MTHSTAEVERDLPADLDRLSERNQYIVKLHVSSRKTLAAIGDIVGVSGELCRRIVRQAGVPQEVTRQVLRENRHPRATFVCEHCGREKKMKPSLAKKRRFCSIECSHAHGRLTDEDLLETLRDLAGKLGRTPTTEDLSEFTPHSHHVYYARFGSFRKAQRRAGLKPNKIGGNRRA